MNELISGFLGAGSITAVISSFIYRENRKANIRQALFNCLNGYLKIMDYHSHAIKEKTKAAYFAYYRSLIDLQWSEYYMFLNKSIPYIAYKSWADARYKDFKRSEFNVEVENNSKDECCISYKIVWEKLISEEYFSEDDTFTIHMSRIHSGDINGALAMREELFKRNILGELILKKQFNRENGK